MTVHKLAGFLLVLALSPVLIAQSSGTAGLTGTVTDPTGAAVPNVNVTAINAGNNSVRMVLTGSDGTYLFNLLPPGEYRVRFTASGFKVAEISSVTLNVTETPVLNRALEVGAQSDQVAVEASAETLQTATSSLGTTVGARAVVELPLASRNFTQIIALSAGASASVNNATALGKGTLDMAVNGSNPSQNNFQVDGVAINNIANNGSANDSGIYGGIGIPNPDALMEFRIQTSTYDAGYGRNPGANVNVVTKSGTNTWHGTAFEFLRNSELNANSFFYNRDHPNSSTSRQVLDQNQFGGVLGGPIRRDKLFIFGSYQGTRSRNGVSPEGNASGIILPPIPGDNSTDRTTPQFLQSLIADNCGPTVGGLPATLTGTPLSCSATSVSGPAMKILQLKTANGNYYIPGTGGVQKVNTAYSIPSVSSEDQLILNGDYIVSSKNTLAMRYFYGRDPRTIPFPAFGVNLPGSPASTYNANSNAVLRLTTIVTNSFLNEARLSFQRNLSTSADQTPAATAASLGITPLVPGTLPPPMLFSVNNFSLFGALTDPSYSPSNQAQAADQISWSRGKHTIRAGVEVEETRWNLVFGGLERGTMILGTFQDLLVGQAKNLLSCLYCVRSGPDGIIHGYRLPNGSGFVQDDWKAGSKLTVNMGVRWEYDGEISDIYGNLTNIWISQLAPNSQVPSSPIGAAGNYAGYVVPNNFDTKTWGSLPSGIKQVSGASTISGHPPYNNFAPRLGLAYQVTRKVVLRAGSGLFYDRVGMNWFYHSVQQSNPYAATVSFGPASTIDNPYPAQPALGTFGQRWVDLTKNCSAAQPCTSGLNQPFLNERLHTPLTRQYNINLQWEVARNTVLEGAYVGANAINLTDFNHNYNSAAVATPSNPVNGLTTTTVANRDLRVPYLGFTAAGLQGAAEDGRSNFNSLQATLRKQMSHGVTMQAAYTYGKSLSDILQWTANGNLATNMAQQYGPTDFNRPQRFVASYSWDLPLASGKGFAGAVLGGWNLSGVTTVQSGVSLILIDQRGGTAYLPSTNNASLGYSRPQLCPGVTYAQVPSSGSLESRLNGYWNASAFCAPPVIGDDGSATAYGNAGGGILLGPGQFNFDTALLKTTHIREKQTVQFRAEFFNLFNHPQFSNPGAAGSAVVLADVRTNNRITSTSVNPRIVQLALKFTF